MNRETRTVRRALIAWVLLIAAAWAPPASAEEIKLKDGTELSASLLDLRGETAILGVARSSIATVDGQPMPPPVVVGSQAPAFTAADLSGATQSLEANRGHVTLVKFWATWCPHCRADIPYMKELHGRYAGQGLRLLTISVDQDVGALKAFVQEQQLAYPVISVAEAPDLPARYETQGVPGYYVIGADGTILKIWPGSLTESEARGKSELESLLPTLLADPGA